jgi:hypothetical protein
MYCPHLKFDFKNFYLYTNLPFPFMEAKKKKLKYCPHKRPPAPFKGKKPNYFHPHLADGKKD